MAGKRAGEVGRGVVDPGAAGAGAGVAAGAGAGVAASLVELTPFFKAFCNTTRASIIDLLLEGERCVCEITPAIDASQPLVSHHLAILREAGFVRMREQGSRTYYAIDWQAFDVRVGEFLALTERGRAAAGVRSEAC